MKAAFCFIALTLCLASGVSASAKWAMVEDHEILDDYAVTFKVGLKQQNIEYMDSLLWKITDMASPMFGKHLTNEQIADLISLPEESIQEVEKFLTTDAGKFCDVEIHRSVHRDYIYVNTCAAQAQKIFPNLKLRVYQHTEGGKKLLRSAILMDVAENAYLLGVPTELHAHIAGIHDITDLPITKYGHRNHSDPSLPWQKDTKAMTMQDMVKLFGIDTSAIKPETLSADHGQVRQAVIELNNANFSASELESYQKKYGLPINPIRKVVGTEEDGAEESVEASLDVQTITGLTGNVQTWDFVFDGTASWIDVVETIMSTPGAPMVYSVSWIAQVSDFTQSQLDATNNEYLKFGLAGFTFVEGSGDWGPSLGPDCKKFDPEFPSSSPYVLSVGGTKINKNTNVEEAWMHSSGGFSGKIKRPAYQDEKVEHYIKNTPLPPNPDGRYTLEGRAWPDIAAIGAYQQVLADGKYMPVGGTSEATPQVAAMVALINILRYQKGLGPVGVINPTLWKMDSVGFDVTIGFSYAAGVDTCDGTYIPGYHATEGWDPLTGLGSPRFDLLVKTFVDSDK